MIKKISKKQMVCLKEHGYCCLLIKKDSWLDLMTGLKIKLKKDDECYVAQVVFIQSSDEDYEINLVGLKAIQIVTQNKGLKQK